MENKTEYSLCCNKRIVGVTPLARGDEQKMCTGCGKLLGIKEKRLANKEHLTRKEKKDLGWVEKDV